MSSRCSGCGRPYGDVEAVRGIDFAVREGEIFALLGPNGAGQDDHGRDPRGLSRPRRRERCGSSASIPRPAAPATETASASCCRRRASSCSSPSRKRCASTARTSPVAATAARAGRARRPDREVRTRASARCPAASCADSTSRSRSSVVPRSSSSTNPPPASIRRRAAGSWDLIESLRDLGTHHRARRRTTWTKSSDSPIALAVIAHGEMVALGSPADLGAGPKYVCVAFRLPPGVAPSDLPPLDGAARVRRGQVVVETLTPTELLHELTGWAMPRGIELEQLRSNRPSLEDVYPGADDPDGRRRVRTARLITGQIRHQARLVARNRLLLFFTFALPLLLFFMFQIVIHGRHLHRRSALHRAAVLRTVARGLRRRHGHVLVPRRQHHVHASGRHPEAVARHTTAGMGVHRGPHRFRARDRGTDERTPPRHHGRVLRPPHRGGRDPGDRGDVHRRCGRVRRARPRDRQRSHRTETPPLPSRTRRCSRPRSSRRSSSRSRTRPPWCGSSARCCH